MRRSDYDISDTVRTTEPGEVSAAVSGMYRALYGRSSAGAIERAFRDLERIYAGNDAGFHACDTEYHDVQHVLDVTLAMARLMDAYERTRNGADPLPPDLFSLGVVTALYHDFGYLRRRGDRRHRYGAEYTLTHVTRGAHFLRRYLPRLGLARYVNDAAKLVHFTGYERRADTIRIRSPLLRKLGHMLGTADIVAQMSDRCYLEKCRDRLYPEFVLGGLAKRRLADGHEQVLFASGEDLVRKTPGFYANAAKRLDEQLSRSYRLFDHVFNGSNPYQEEMQKNVRHAQAIAQRHEGAGLRRTPPLTLAPEAEPYPKSLVIR